MTSMSHSVRGAALAALVVLATACVAPVGKVKGVPLYFPPSPELPRLQYLTSFSGSRDVETQTAFNRFVVGEKQILICPDNTCTLKMYVWEDA